MRRSIRRLLHLPLLTTHEQRTLSGMWWKACTTDFPDMMRADLYKQEIPIEDKQAVTYILDEFSDAIEWIERMKA